MGGRGNRRRGRVENAGVALAGGKGGELSMRARNNYPTVIIGIHVEASAYVKAIVT